MELDKAIGDIKAGLSHDFSSLREELDEHLTAINENTDELESYGEELYHFSERLDRMEGRMNELALLFKTLVRQTRCSVALDKEEQRAFLVLYTSDSFMSARMLATKLGCTPDVAQDLIMSMSDKGILFEHERLDSREYVRLEKEFRTLYAQEQLIKIEPEVKQQFHNSLLHRFFEN